jgi:biotin operon repressor
MPHTVGHLMVKPSLRRPMTEQLDMNYLPPRQPPRTASTPPDPGGEITHDERRVLSTLRKGRENAISMSALAEQLNISTRELQSVIQHLINDHGYMIASATGKNHGYYYPGNEEEYRAAVDQLKHRIISLARRIRAIDKQAFQEIFGQGSFTEL